MKGVLLSLPKCIITVVVVMRQCMTGMIQNQQILSHQSHCRERILPFCMDGVLQLWCVKIRIVRHLENAMNVSKSMPPWKVRYGVLMTSRPPVVIETTILFTIVRSCAMRRTVPCHREELGCTYSSSSHVRHKASAFASIDAGLSRHIVPRSMSSPSHVTRLSQSVARLFLAALVSFS